MNPDGTKQSFGMFGVVGWLFNRLLASLREAGQDLCHLVAWGRAALGRHQAAKQLGSAQAALGEQLTRSGLGDESLRQQVGVVDDRIKSVKAAQGASKELEAERRGLLIRLAETYTTPSDLSGELGMHAESRDRAKLALNQRQCETAQARQLLRPDGHLRLNFRCWSFGFVGAFLGILWADQTVRKAVSEYPVPQIEQAEWEGMVKESGVLESPPEWFTKKYGDSSVSREVWKAAIRTADAREAVTGSAPFREWTSDMWRDQFTLMWRIRSAWFLYVVFMFGGGMFGFVCGLGSHVYAKWSRTVAPVS